MNIPDSQLVEIVLDFANLDRVDDGLPVLTHAEVAEFKASFANSSEEDRNQTRSMVAALAESISKHIGLRGPRDERLVVVAMHDHKYARPALDVELPHWVLQQAEDIERYMSSRFPENWKLGGIQKRTY